MPSSISPWECDLSGGWPVPCAAPTPPPEVHERALAIGAAGLSIYEVGLTAEIVDAIHAAGMQAWVWTVNDPARALEIAAMGADAICTDAPAQVIAALEVGARS